MRRTKIICTLGPATDDPEVLKKLMLNGMNVARLNFSHGVHADHLVRMNAVKKIRDELDLPIAIMLDTRGPEIRIKTFKNDMVEVETGGKYTLTTEDIEGDEKRVSVTYPGLPDELKSGSRILIDDGLIELEVESINKPDINCRVINGGVLRNRKSINLPDTHIEMPYMNEGDKADIIFGAQQDVDYIAASFVRNAYDVLEVKKILEDCGCADIRIIAKIENREGVNNIDEILAVADGIMVARGDMGVEIAMEELPRIQKMLIKKCYAAGKTAITATQMLESMINNPRPTRAEVTDIANAIYDGTSAIMLSGETAAGKHPVEAARTMAKIAETTEQAIDYKARFAENSIGNDISITNAISHATCTTAIDLGAAAIITVTQSGYTARMISKFRPDCPIIVPTISEKNYRQLALAWGVVPARSKFVDSTDELFDLAVDIAKSTGLVSDGDVVVITGGAPVGVSGTTNILKVHLVGDVLVQGSSINKLNASGELLVSQNFEEDMKRFHDGMIICVPKTANYMLPMIKRCAGIICEEEGVGCHASVVGLALDIPVIVGAKNATKLLKTGTVVTIDGEQGMVYGGTAKML
ncbi:MAG: pyruvate kinase [Oscillospiraceae bacterium]|nr:pyruvate kinase [Oscillospiraceae bacterium]